jgi:hypothetical protein
MKAASHENAQRMGAFGCGLQNPGVEDVVISESFHCEHGGAGNAKKVCNSIICV